MRRMLLAVSLAVSSLFLNGLANAQGPAPNPRTVTLVSAAKYATLQEAVDNERYLYVPAGWYRMDEPLVIDGWDDGIIMGAGRLWTGSILYFNGNNGIQIKNCRRLKLMNFYVHAWDTTPGNAAIDITGDQTGEVELLNNMIYCGRVHGTPDDIGGIGIAFRAPGEFTIQSTNVQGGDIAILLDHPDADLCVVGGNQMGNNTGLLQRRGHFNLWGPGSVGSGRNGAEIEITSAADEPFVICGIRTEGVEHGQSTQYLVRTAVTDEPIDIIMKANSISDARPVEYNAAGTLTMVGNDAVRGGVRVPAGSGRVWSVGNVFGMFGEPVHAPYTINPDAQVYTVGDIWAAKEFESETAPNNRPLGPAALKEWEYPIPENVDFLGSGAVVPELGEPATFRIAEWPVITNIGDLVPSVRDWGAVGDGVTDDTDALQRAIDEHQDGEDPYNNGGHPLYFPPGVYAISKPLLWSSAHGGWWIGAGMDETIIRNTVGGAAVATNACGYATFQDMTFETLVGDPEPAFDLNWDNVANNFGAALQANVFYRCRFIGGNGCYYGRGGAQGDTSLWLDCEFLRCKSAYVSGNPNTLNNNLVRCLFQDCDVAAEQWWGGSFCIYFSRFERSKLHDIYIGQSTNDAFHVMDCTSNSAVSLYTGYSAAPINVLFENFRSVGPTRTEPLVVNAAGGCVTFVNSDIGDATLAAGGSMSYKSMILFGTPVRSSTVFDIVDLARAYLLQDKAEGAAPLPLDPSTDLTFVAGGSLGDGGTATAATLAYPGGLCLGNDGSIYVADLGNNRIRKVDASTGTIATVAGDGRSGFAGDNGPATDASLSLDTEWPSVISIDTLGNLYIADTGNRRVRKVDASTGIITTVAGNGELGYAADGGAATEAAIGRPTAVAVDSAGNLYIGGQTTVRKVSAADATIARVAGDGALGSMPELNVYDYGAQAGVVAADASLNNVSGLYAGSPGYLYISDRMNHKVRKVDLATELMISVAGNQLGTSGYGGYGGPALVDLDSPAGISVDSAGNIYIADSRNNRVRQVFVELEDAAYVEQFVGKMNQYAGSGSTEFVGDGGPATDAGLNHPMGVTLDRDRNLYLSDSAHGRIRKVDSTTGIITTIAGNGGFSGDGGSATAASLNGPRAVFVNGSGEMYIADNDNLRVRKVDASGTISTVAGNGQTGMTGDGAAATEASFSSLSAIQVTAAGDLYVADEVNGLIRKVDGITGLVSTIAGADTSGYSGDGGLATAAKLDSPTDIAMGGGGILYIADRDNNCVRMIDAAGTITTVAGSDSAGFSGDGGAATDAELDLPTGLFVDGWGTLYVADSGNDRIRKVDVAGTITTIAGGGDWGAGNGYTLDRPEGVFLDGAGDLFIADTGNGRVVKVDAVTGEAEAVVEGLSGPTRVFVDGEGALYVIDRGLNQIPRLEGIASPTTLPVRPTPVLTSISPASGTIKGGSTIVLTGANYAAGATVSIGETAATGVEITSSREIRVTLPEGTEGAVDVTVTLSDGQTATLAGAFNYTAYMKGDFNGNGSVEFGDFIMFESAYGGTDATYDLDGNGSVDFIDFVQFAAVYGTSG